MCPRSGQIFSSSFGVVFSQFLPLNAPITPYNIRYWWFFLSQGNRWIIYRTHPKIRRPKPYQLTFAFLVALDGFLPFAVHSADCQFDSGVYWWIHISSSVLKVLIARRISREHEHMLENMLGLFVLWAFTEHLRAFKMYSLSHVLLCPQTFSITL